MKIIGPARYRLTFDAQSFSVRCSKGSTKFSGFASGKLPKLCIASVAEKPVYVGVTKQPIRNRLRFGWNADGQDGYYGYAWRRQFTEANLDIWCHEDPPEQNPLLEIETVEAEVVFLIRCAGQWPMYQTEIHFHPSGPVHRQVAASIVANYGLEGGHAGLVLKSQLTHS